MGCWAYDLGMFVCDFAHLESVAFWKLHKLLDFETGCQRRFAHFTVYPSTVLRSSSSL